jgi:hypothetical protein
MRKHRRSSKLLISNAVSTALLPIVIGWLAAPMATVSAGETYDCGQYQIAGKLRERGTGVHVLEIFPGTTTRFDLVIHGLPTEDSIAYKDHKVQFKAFIYRAGTGGSARARYVGPISSASQDQVNSQAIHLLHHETCPASAQPDSGPSSPTTK